VIAIVVAAWRIVFVLADSGPVPKLAGVILALLYGFVAYWFWRAMTTQAGVR